LSPAYLASNTAPSRIAAVIPAVRLIVVLRPPVDRAVSDYHYRQGRGTVRRMPLEEAIDADPSIVTRGFYAQHLSRYLEHFERSQLLLLEFCDLQKRPGLVVQQIGDFLGVQLTARPPSVVVNASGVPKHPALNRALSVVERAMRRPPLDVTWRALRGTRLRGLVRGIRKPAAGGTRELVSPAAIERLAAIFEPDLSELEVRCGFTFSAECGGVSVD
jgi:hypothetical protein